MIPAEDIVEHTSTSPAAAAKLHSLEIKDLLRDGHFIKTILLIGVPAKAVLTGVVLFAVPLMLSEMAFAKEDIGQITMIYAGCVIISSAIAGHLADRLRTSRQFLVWGGLMTAAGLVIMSFSGNEAVALSSNAMLIRTALVVIGAAVVGMAHGLINAPIITHITDTSVAQRIGEVPTAATYRLLERAGHMLGPIVLAQFFLVFGTSPIVLGWLGIGMIALTLAFHFAEPEQTKPVHKEEFA